MLINEFRVLEQIHASRDTTVYRGIRPRDGLAVILKVLNREFPTENDLSRFTREYKVLSKLDGRGNIKSYGLEKFGNSLLMVNEDIGGESLAAVLSGAFLDLPSKLSLSVLITDALAMIHGQSIIHKDINPSNIIWNPRTNRLKIADFGIACELVRETQRMLHPNILEGTLSYISPEQTGRMNRAMDFRTDLYSLGVTLYELFTGRLPFKADDALGMVHSHMAVIPERPDHADPGIPAPLADIVMRLLAKTPEERYQGCMGLKKDLENILDAVKLGRSLDSFEIGLHDRAGFFQIPQKLYGREKDVEALLKAYTRITEGGKEIMLVAGYSGIGKTALVQELHKPVVKKHGFFISGKFDQYKRNIPYSALIQAFRNLVKNLLADDDARLAEWKKKITGALGASGRVVADVIPEIELIIGDQPPIQELDPDQSKNRFHIVFRKFLRVFADKEHPLTLFLDDLQWADLPSLQMIEQFMADMDTAHLLIIGAYRDNEEEAAQFLLEFLAHMEESGTVISTIVLAPLEPGHVDLIAADVMACPPEQAEGLSRICYEKTMGNPFFIGQLLTTFDEEKIIYFSSSENVWCFDEHAAKKSAITENVVDLMTGKILRLDRDVQDILRVASCIGSSFDLSTLAQVCGKPENLTADLLFMALRESLVVPMDENYRFVSESHRNPEVKYRFLHDRIQQAAYSLIPEEDRQRIHLRIGRILLDSVTDDDPGEKLFDTVNHLDLGAAFITDPAEKKRVSVLNLQAGQKARQSAAFKPAWEYARKGIDLCGESGWKRSYRHMLALHNEAMEALYLNGNFMETEKLFQVIENRTKTIMDKVKAYEIRILALISESRFKEALDTGMVILGLLGYRFPEQPKKWHLLAGLVKIKIALGKTNDEAILSAKAMADPKVLAAAGILHKITSTALFSKPNLYPLIIFKRVELSLKYGEDPLFSFSAYTSLGIIFCSLGRLDEGFRTGKLAETLLARSKIKKEKTRIAVVMNMFIRHWKEHLENTVKPLVQAIESRLETGDIEYASHAVSAYCLHIFHCGKPLRFVESEQRQYLKSIRLLEQKFDVDNVCNFHQATLNLMDGTKPLTDYSGSSFDEKTLLPVLYEERNITALFSYNLNKLYLYYHAGEYGKAMEHFPHVESYLTSVRALIVVVVYNFYSSLTRLALLQKGDGNRRREIRHVEKNQKLMKKWALNAPMNHLHKWHLVEAEKAWVLGLWDKGKHHYKEAVLHAGKNGYIQDEALSNERYAQFLLAQGDDDFADLVMKKAQYLYGIWGAAAKVSYLQATWPNLTGLQGPSTETLNGPKTDSGYASKKITSSDALDMATILKASRMISREIVLAKLIEKILGLCMENAGAEKCFVILEQKGRLCIEGEAVAGAESFQVLSSIPVERHQGLSAPIVNYVARTKRVLILDDAASEGDFTGDPYVVRNRPRSIMCSPILNQGQISAILYMENNLSRAAFRLERMELLNALASQGAISINNARLYENLEEKVEERTRALNESLEKVEEANEHIMKSIRYSSMIQKSLLPAPGAVSEFLPMSFFIWKPRDIVGGDIYVCEKIDRGIAVALIDCTGHGIPGAFMTMLASSGLRRILREEKLFMPDKILKRLNHIIKTSLQQDTEHARSDDGLDAAVCCFDEESGRLYFSGARMPLYIMDKGELTTVKGDRMSIGYVSSDLSYAYTVHEIDNSRGGKQFYMSTDGYTDQLGGEDGIRFGSGAFKQLILENHDKPFREQAEILKSALERHRGRRERTDDVTVAGFMFG